MSAPSKNTNFVKGATLLALAGVLVHVIGVFYRIPLVKIIKPAGSALYHMAYPFYTYLLTFSTAGVPSAISKIVSEHLAAGDGRAARRVFRVSMALFTAIGALTMLGMLVLAPWLAEHVSRDELARPSIMAIAPALLFVSIISVYRGYFQGMQDMKPTAISQVVEQTVKLGISFFLAARMMPYGVQYGAAGALLGVSISEAVAMLGLMLTYWRRRGDMPGVLRASPVEPAGSVIQRLLRLTIPMLLAASVLPLTQMADVAIVMQRLEALGYLKETARELFGILTGFVYPLVNVPSVLSLSLSTSMVPSVAESNARGDIRAVQRKSALGLKIGMLVSIPSAVGMSVLARPIMDLLFGADLMEHGVAIAGDLLVIASLSVLLLAVVQATNGVLQGIGRVRIPMVGLMMGGVTKIITNYILVGIPQINIYGAPVGNILCYLVAAVVNLVALARLTHLRYNWLDLFCKPLLASVMMGLVAYGVQLLVGNLLSAGIATVVAVLAAVPAYVCFALLVGALGREELSMIPGGSRLLPWARRLRQQD